MNKLKDLLKYTSEKFPFKERVYHKDFFINKDKNKEGIYISVCVGRNDPLIRVYNKEELIEELYMSEGKIKIEQELENINDTIKLPNIDYIFEITKKILDKYTHEEIMMNCFSNFDELSQLEDDIQYKIRDLKKKQRDYENICKYVKLSKEEQDRRQEIENVLLNI